MDIQRTHTPGRLGILALAAALALGACGGDNDEPANPPRAAEEGTSASDPVLTSEVPDLCGVFTAEDFATVTGEKAGPSERQEPIGAIRGSCTLSAEAGFPLVMIAAYDEADRESTLSMVDPEPVDDLGVTADWDESTGLLVPLEGRDWYLQVLVTDGGADRDASVEAARIVLDRL